MIEIFYRIKMTWKDIEMSDKDSPTQNVTVVIQDKGLKIGTIGLIIGDK